MKSATDRFPRFCLFLCLYSLTAHAQNGPFLYVPDSGNSNVSVVDTSNNSTPFAPILVGPGIAAAVRGDESVVYVTDNTGTVTPVDTAANTLGKQISVGSIVQDLAITPNGKTVYVATVTTVSSPGAIGFLTPINTADNTKGTPIDVGFNPRGVVMSPDGRTLYVANLIVPSLEMGTVTPVNTATNTAGAPIEVGLGNQAFSLAITPDGKTVYVGNPFGNSVIAINTATKGVTAIPVGAASFGLAVSPNGATLYVANAFTNTVTVVNTTNNTVEGSISVPGTPNGVAVSPDGKTVYVTNFSNGTVTAINATTNAVVATIPVGMMPEIFPGIAWNGNALLASGLTFVAHTSGALESTLASGPTGSPGPIFTGGTLQFAGPNITSALPITLGSGGGTFDTLANNATLSGTISGPGALTKIGTGTLTLIGTNTYSGGTIIDEGTLVAGVPNAAQAISNALGTGNVFLNGGTLRTPGLNPLTINIVGNYAQGPGGTLALGVAGIDGKDYDHVLAGGNATLNGTLAVSSLNNFRPSNGNDFEVLHTGGSRSGEFSHINDSLNNNPSLQRIDIYAPNGVALLYVATPGPTPAPSPPTQAPTPTPIPDVVPEPLPPVNPDKPLLLSFLLSILSPTVEQLTSMFEISFSGTNTQRFNLDNRLAEIQRGSTGFVSTIPQAPPSGKETVFQKDGKAISQPAVFQPTPENRWGVWVNGWGDFVSVGDDNFAKGYDFTTGGVTVGIDYRITDHLALGIFGSYAHTWTDLQPGHVDVNTGRGGLYASYFDHGFYVNGAVFGGYNSYDTSRQALLGSATGSTDGEEFSTFIGAGYNFHFGNFTVGPVAALQYTYVNVDGFREQGSLLPLQIHSDSQDSLRTDVGLQASYTWHAGSMLIIPSVTAAWEHEYKYSALPLTVSAPLFGGASATFFGPSEGHDSAIVNAGVGVQLTPRISTYVGYQGQLGRDRYDANAVTGSISFSF